MASVIQVDDTFSPLLSEVAEINPRFDRSAVSDTSEAISFVPMANVSEQTGSITHEIERPISEVLKGFTPFQRGDVLVAKITPCFENGKIAHAIIDRRFGFGSTEFHVVRAHPDVLDDRYLYHFLRRDRIRLEGERKMTGSAGQRRVPKHFLESLRIPLPPLEEQRRIAAILDKADALRAKRREAIAKLDQLLQSVFLEMFGDPVTNPMGWPCKTIGELAKKITSGSRGWAKYYSDEGALFLRIQNLVSGELVLDDVARVNPPDSAEAQRTRVEADDVLVSITADLGRTAVVPDSIETAHINQHLAILRLADINPTYAAHYLASAGGVFQFKKLDRVGVKSGLNFNDLRGLKILVPSLSAQERYTEFVSKVRIQQSAALNSQKLFENNFRSLQQHAFSGEL